MLRRIRARLRPIVQAAAALAFNPNIPGFFRGSIYTGPLKGVCVPVLNCYSCPGALGACPIGALQSSLNGMGARISAYVLGMLLLFALTLGRWFCGWLCQFGWLQELLHKLPVRKLRVPLKLDKPLRYLKYAVLALMVVGLPLLVRNGIDMSLPYFCKYLCPAGLIGGGIPLALANSAIRESLGGLFVWKLFVALVTLAACLVLYRPFCKYLCPLGAFYGLFSRLSLYSHSVDASLCTRCNACSAACPMQADPALTPNHSECIRCGACVKACPSGAICAGFGRSFRKGANI